MKKLIRSAVHVLGATALVALVFTRAVDRLTVVHAQLPHQSTGHLVTAVEWNAMVDAINAVTSVPSGTIAYFNSGSCPSGWGEYTTARGFYLVGRPAGGTLATAVGSALADLENRAHTHSIPGLTIPGLNYDTTTDDQGSHTHTFTTGGPSNTGTNSSGGGGSFGFAATDHTHSGTTDSAGSHHHRAAGTTSGGTTSTGTSGSQSTTIAPYIELLVCQKT